MTQFTLHFAAFVKPLLHAAKYPTSTVTGVLLATQDTCDLVDAIPLFHQFNHLSCMLDVALDQIALYCKHHKLRIAGMYQANASLDTHPHPTTTKIMHSLGDSAVLLMVDVKRYNDAPNMPFQPYIIKDRQLKKSGQDVSFVLGHTALPSLVRTAIDQDAYLNVVDFDAHLDDVRGDWLVNPTVMKLSTQL
jgi:hypothetical protein